MGLPEGFDALFQFTHTPPDYLDIRCYLLFKCGYVIPKGKNGHVTGASSSLELSEAVATEADAGFDLSPVWSLVFAEDLVSKSLIEEFFLIWWAVYMTTQQRC
ncbi:hypothetical protein NDU88_004951 [Pleurodeles waltl]|uniref:Uncharacterized protein n=1 Tax=Pleurodeles waltl TaxID=8319 RepID=A0AAV7WA36_PLEWA|nr:hypothetical protein NDU88_004951 [Pleurodeles waltl]